MTGLELILSTLCLQSTCPNTTPENTVIPKTGDELRFLELEKEINGQHLKIGTMENYPLSFTKIGDDGKIKLLGVSDILVRTLAERFNFTYDIVLPAKNWEGRFGKLEDSLLGLVNSSKVDFAAAFLPVTNERSKIVLYSAELDEGFWAMMMKRPKESAVGSGLFAPFSHDVWWITLTAVFAYGPCVWLMTKIRRSIKGNSELQEKDNFFTMSYVIWFVYGSFFKQGTTVEPESNSIRILFATWWLFSILINAFYTANLTAFLTLSKFTLEVNEAKDLMKKSYKWIAMEGASIEYLITEPSESLYFLNVMVAKGSGKFEDLSNDSMLLNSISSKSVLIHDQPATDILMYKDYLRKTREGIEESQRCTYVISPKPILKRIRSFAYPMNSTLKILFDPILQSMKESGLIKFLKNFELPGTKVCPLDLNSTERRLQNSDLLMTYVLALIGTAAALISFIIELVLRRFSLKKKRGKTSTNVVSNVTHKPYFENSQPPPYESLYHIDSQWNANKNAKKSYVNGRNYWIVENMNGDIRLIPVRTPSALLFQKSKLSFSKLN